MKLSTLLIRTFKHYFANNLATSAGIALTTAIICGALVIGDSLNNSLSNIVDFRLGSVTHTLTSGDRIFTQNLAKQLEASSIETAPVLKTEAVASIQGGVYKVDKVQVWGVDSGFTNLQKTSECFSHLEDAEAIISLNLSKSLQLKVGDEFRVLLKKIGPIPGNTPFVSEGDQATSHLVTVKAIVDKDSLGAFNLQVSQTAPFNIFVNLRWLNQVMNLKDKVNILLIRSDKQPEVLKQAVRQSCSLGDLNLLWNNSGRITSERVFIEDQVAEALKQKRPQANGVLTYFVNQLKLGTRETPYSFVSAVENRFRSLKDHETVLNAWLADDLNAKIGDSISIRYFVFGPLRTLVEKQTTLKVVDILSMSEAVKDSILMPQLPGLSDAGNCRDWKAGIPIDLKKIRTKDETYWKVFKGTPKAYISLNFGQQLWRNRYGAYTAFLFSEKKLPVFDFDPFKMQFQINEVRKDGLFSAKSGVDFGQLFAGLGVFILASGLLLTILLFNLTLKRREKQIKLYSNLGFSTKLIHRINLTEIFGISLLGTLVGLLVTIGYSKLILLALNQLWNDIVRTNAIELQFKFSTLLFGFLISFLLSMTVVYFGTKRTIDRINKRTEPNRKILHFTKYLSYGFLLAFVILVVLLLSNILIDSIFLWLLAGIILLLASLSGSHAYFNQVSSKSGKTMDVKALGWKNLARNPARSFTIFTLLALGSFVIVVTALNKKNSVDSSQDLSNGTGGFEFIAETTIPILQDLNDPIRKNEYGLPDSVEFIQFHAAFDDQASCLNLNRIINPRILSTDPKKLDGRFSFSSMLHSVNQVQAWLSLDQSFGDLIPAIADQTVIQWGLGKKIGDTLQYVGSSGEAVKLLLIGGLSNSIFQGHVLISDENFRQHFSIGNGSNFILVDCPERDKVAVQEALNLAFRDNGWSMQDCVIKLAEFNSIENTYLSIFFLMGAFGMLLGIVGLSIFLIRNMLERKNELILFKALGFKKRIILSILLYENLTLFFVGIFSGTLSAFVAALPTLLKGGQTVPTGFLLYTLAFLVLNGVTWICIVTLRIVRKTSTTVTNQNE
ncbi:MAG TPA: ABC transporter permease [Bacteroidales bacterium]|nr:ABC transporter permease [Bacteroidales bacterium]